MALKEVHQNMGYEQLTSLSSAATLTVPSVNQGATQGPPISLVLLQAEDQNVRWRDDGTSPTSSTGIVLKAGDPPYPYDGELTKIQFIEETATAKLNVSYYG